MIAALAVGASNAAGGAAAGRTSGAKIPAVGISPHYQVTGQVSASPDTPPTFSCQLSTPAGCYGPAQIRAAYGVDALAARGLTGAGRSIVIVDAFQSPTIQHDLSLFDAVFELPDPTLDIVAPDGLTPFDPNDGNMIGWSGEITLDVEWAHAIAPAARIVLVLAKSNQDADILSATRFAVDHSLGDVISQSFGEAEQCMDPSLLRQQHEVFARATLKGITLLASSGDQGAANTCDGVTFFKAASTPATDPLVTSVGGTILDANGLTGAYNGEVVWNEPVFEAAGGGGFSVLYRTPIYQALQRLPSRGVPDVAYNAAIIGGVLAVWSSSGLGQNLVFRFGGTSAGSPQWAGLTVLANQRAHKRLGFLNPRLYLLAATPGYNALFHDITVGDNTFHGTPEIPGFPARQGWDAASGLGSPKADALVPALAALS
jgi:subtilase family serine protease